MAKLIHLFIVILLFSHLLWGDGSRSFDDSSGQNMSGGNINDVTTGNLTTWAWMKSTEDASVDAVIGKARSLSVNFAGYGIHQSATDLYTAKVYDGTTAASCVSAVDRDGAWTFLLMTWNGTANAIMLYEGNEAACISAIVPVGSLTNGFNFEVGNAGTNAEPANGQIAFAGFANAVAATNLRQELMFRPESVFAQTLNNNVISWPSWGQSGGSEESFQQSTNLTVTSVKLSDDGPPVMIGVGAM